MTKNNLHFIEVMENTDRAAIFGKAIREKRKEQRLTVEAAARKIGISKQYLSVLERAVPSLYTGKSIVPKLETVDSIAEALNWDSDEARLAAGYAPKTITRRPETIPELVAALEQLGIERHRTEVRLYPISTPLSAHISAYIATRIPPPVHLIKK